MSETELQAKRQIRRLTRRLELAADNQDVLQDECDRYRITLELIRSSPMTGVEFGDWVQGLIEDVIEGDDPECPECGNPVLEFPCGCVEHEASRALIEEHVRQLMVAEGKGASAHTS